MTPPPVKKQTQEQEAPNPIEARMEKSPLSAPISRMPFRAAEGTSKKPEDRPSVREELREIRAGMKKQQEAEKQVRICLARVIWSAMIRCVSLSIRSAVFSEYGLVNP